MTTFIVFNMDFAPDADNRVVQSGIDEGKCRTLKDVLRHSKIKNPTAVAALMRRVAAYRQIGVKGLYYPRDMSSDEMLEYADDDLKTYEAYARLSLRTTGIATPTYVAAATYLGCGGCLPVHTSAETFVHAITTGTNLSEDDPVYLLRQRLLKFRDSTARLPNDQRMALTTMAWNKWLMFESCRQLAWNPKRHDFPEPLVINDEIRELWSEVEQEAA